MRKMIVAALALVCVVTQASASSDQGKLGVGVVLGAPTGLSIKYWLNRRIAYQGFIGSMFKGGVTVGADYLDHENALGNHEVPFYYGGGFFIGDAGIGGPAYSHNKLALGIRGVFGLDYLPREYPFDVAAEIGPSLLLTPDVGIGFQLSVAFRFYP